MKIQPEGVPRVPKGKEGKEVVNPTGFMMLFKKKQADTSKQGLPIVVPPRSEGKVDKVKEKASIHAPYENSSLKVRHDINQKEPIPSSTSNIPPGTQEVTKGGRSVLIHPHLHSPTKPHEKPADTNSQIKLENTATIIKPLSPQRPTKDTLTSFIFHLQTFPPHRVIRGEQLFRQETLTRDVNAVTSKTSEHTLGEFSSEGLIDAFKDRAKSKDPEKVVGISVGDVSLDSLFSTIRDVKANGLSFMKADLVREVRQIIEWVSLSTQRVVVHLDDRLGGGEIKVERVDGSVTVDIRTEDVRSKDRLEFLLRDLKDDFQQRGVDMKFDSKEEQRREEKRKEEGESREKGQHRDNPKEEDGSHGHKRRQR